MAETAYRVRHAFARPQEDGRKKWYTADNAADVAEDLTQKDRDALVKRGYLEEYDPKRTTATGAAPRRPVVRPGVAGIAPEETPAATPKGSSKGK